MIFQWFNIQTHEYELYKLWKLASEFELMIKIAYEKVVHCFRRIIYPQKLCSEIDENEEIEETAE